MACRFYCGVVTAERLLLHPFFAADRFLSSCFNLGFGRLTVIAAYNRPSCEPMLSTARLHRRQCAGEHGCEAKDRFCEIYPNLIKHK